MYGIVDCLLMSAGQLAWTIVKGPLEAIVGILYGIICGVILWYLPHSKHVSCVLVLSLFSFVAFILLSDLFLAVCSVHWTGYLKQHFKGTNHSKLTL